MTLWVGERTGTTRARSDDELRADVDDWSRLIDCGVVGLGN